MKSKRFLLLVMAICLASGVKAQFYDSANDIYYYLLESKDGKTASSQDVRIFNFDGRKACELACHSPQIVQKNLKENQDFYGELVETTKYDLEYSSGSSGTRYTKTWTNSTTGMGGETWFHNVSLVYSFSSDRRVLTLYSKTKSQTYDFGYIQGINPSEYECTSIYKKVEQSYFQNGFFGEGRQRK